MDVKRAASMPMSFSAIRQRIELPANAIKARPNRATTLTIGIGLCNGYWVAVYASNVENNWSLTHYCPEISLNRLN